MTKTESTINDILSLLMFIGLVSWAADNFVSEELKDGILITIRNVMFTTYAAGHVMLSLIYKRKLGFTFWICAVYLVFFAVLAIFDF